MGSGLTMSDSHSAGGYGVIDIQKSYSRLRVLKLNENLVEQEQSSG